MFFESTTFKKIICAIILGVTFVLAITFITLYLLCLKSKTNTTNVSTDSRTQKMTKEKDDMEKELRKEIKKYCRANENMCSWMPKDTKTSVMCEGTMKVNNQLVGDIVTTPTGESKWTDSTVGHCNSLDVSKDVTFHSTPSSYLCTGYLLNLNNNSCFSSEKTPKGEEWRCKGLKTHPGESSMPLRGVPTLETCEKLTYKNKPLNCVWKENELLTRQSNNFPTASDCGWIKGDLHNYEVNWYDYTKVEELIPKKLNILPKKTIDRAGTNDAYTGFDMGDPLNYTSTIVSPFNPECFSCGFFSGTNRPVFFGHCSAKKNNGKWTITDIYPEYTATTVKQAQQWLEEHNGLIEVKQVEGEQNYSTKSSWSTISGGAAFSLPVVKKYGDTVTLSATGVPIVHNVSSSDDISKLNLTGDNWDDYQYSYWFKITIKHKNVTIPGKYTYRSSTDVGFIANDGTEDKKYDWNAYSFTWETKNTLTLNGKVVPFQNLKRVGNYCGGKFLK
jgi:hypothetical protein